MSALAGLQLGSSKVPRPESRVEVGAVHAQAASVPWPASEHQNLVCAVRIHWQSAHRAVSRAARPSLASPSGPLECAAWDSYPTLPSWDARCLGSTRHAESRFVCSLPHPIARTSGSTSHRTSQHACVRNGSICCTSMAAWSPTRQAWASGTWQSHSRSLQTEPEATQPSQHRQELMPAVENGTCHHTANWQQMPAAESACWTAWTLPVEFRVEASAHRHR